MSTQDVPDPISPPVVTLVEIFSNHLADVEFPGVSAEGLADLCAQARRAAQELAVAEQSAKAAAQSLRDASDRLTVQAKQALAYARVYAADDSKLSEQLEEIRLGAPRKKAPPRRPVARKTRTKADADNVSKLPAPTKARKGEVQTAS